MELITLRLGICEDIVHAPARFFDAVKEDEWLSNDFVKEMIRDVDKSEVMGNNVINSTRFGLIPPQWLSGGVKTLILIYYLPNYIFNGSQLGDNCIKWLLEIGKKVDRTVWLGHLYDINYGTDYEPEDEWFEIRIEDDKGNSTIVKSYKDFVNFAYNRIGDWFLSEDEEEDEDTNLDLFED